MKKLNFYALACVGLIGLFIVAGSAVKAQAGPHGDVSGFCSDNDDFGRSHGECVSIAQANINALAGRGNTDGATICKLLEEVFGPFPLGQCISRFASH